MRQQPASTHDRRRDSAGCGSQAPRRRSDVDAPAHDGAQHVTGRRQHPPAPGSVVILRSGEMGSDDGSGDTAGEARDPSAAGGGGSASDVLELARLRARERQLQAVAELGLEAIGAPAFAVLIDRVVQSVARALAVEVVAIEELLADGGLVVHAAVGVGERALGRQQAGAGEGSQAGYTVQAGTPVITDDLLTEARFRPAAVLTRSAARSSLSVAVGSPQRPWGVLLAASTRERRFSEDDVGFLQGVANVLAMATDQRTAERERERTLADLEEAQRLARLGSWSWNPSADQVSWSAQMYAIFGRAPVRGPPSIRAFVAYIHPDDRERVTDAYAQALAGETAFELECRIVAGDEAQRTVHALAHKDAARPGAYLGTIQDVTRQRRTERERLALLETTARAESANRAKSEFLARMSHELRTPLNSIIGFSQVLQLEGLAPRQGEDIGHILKAGNQLLELVNEVLDLARIESGQMTISPEPVAVADTARDALALLAPTARERHISLAVNTEGLADDGHMFVQADRNRFNQVLLNLLSNAIKYNRPGGRVEISCQITDNTRVRTAIADTGIGISPEHLDKLFEPFQRLGAERSEIEGTGLGLAISKGLIEAMGGTIEVDSTVGIGTTFTVELAPAQPTAAQHRPSSSDPDLAGPADPNAKRQLILYIEDNLSNLTLVQRILERQANVKLISAMQATIGLELARQHHPDLIVLDLHLPDMPGTEVLKRLKQQPPTREIPVIVLTADASGRQTERVKQLGATDYLTKPLDIPKFLQILADNLAQQPDAEP